MSLLFATKKKQCPECGCAGTACACGCPCGTVGGLMSCDGRKAFPVDATFTLTNTIATTEWYCGPGRLYRNLADIAAWIAETDPNAASDGYNGLIFKVRSKWEWTADSYTITDNTSVGCNTNHAGYRYRAQALNGDTYLFDAMGGLPRIQNTFTVLEVIRRSGNDVSGTDDDGHSFENHFQDEPEPLTGDALSGTWFSNANADSHGTVSFVSTFAPEIKRVPGATSVSAHASTQGLRYKVQNSAYDYTSDTGRISNFVRILTDPMIAPVAATGVATVFGNSGTFEKTVDGIGAMSPAVPPPNVCAADIMTSYEDGTFGDYVFDVDARSEAAGSFISVAGPPPFFTASTYVTEEPLAYRANFTTAIEATTTVGLRSNPGGQTCSRCYTVEFTETDGDTSAVTTLFSGEVFQLLSSRIGPGEDPRTREGWTSSTIWGSRGVFPAITISRVGKELWSAEIQQTTGGPVFQVFLKGGDCLDSITDVRANVTEVMTWTTTGNLTVADPRVITPSSRLKIDTRSFVATPSTCSVCLEDPCEEPCPSESELWNTGEDLIEDFDQRWEIETSEGSGSYTPARSYPPFPLHATPGPDASWIGLENGDPFPSEEVRRFRTYITVGGTPFDITGVLNSDTSVVTISVNGVVVDGPIATNPYSFTLPAAELINGTNVIIFEVFGDGIVTDGLLVEWD